MKRNESYVERLRRLFLLGAGISISFPLMATPATGDDGTEDYLAVTTLHVGAIYNESDFQIRFVFPTENDQNEAEVEWAEIAIFYPGYPTDG